MKLITKFSIIAGGIISAPLIAALFIDKKYNVERKVTLNRSKQEVFEYIKYLKNQDRYSKWAAMDPQMVKSYRGKDGQVGFVSAWDSVKGDVGKGEQEIVNIKEGERVDYELRFIKPFQSTSKAYMTTESISDKQTSVKWGISGQMNYPMNLMLPIMNFDKMMGKDLDQGLQNLKRELEK